MHHSRAPVLEALQEFRRRGDVVYGPPGHKQGRGADPRVLEVVGADVFGRTCCPSTASTTAGSPRGSMQSLRVVAE